MNIEFFIIGVLVVLLIGQQVYWAKLTLSLANRLMSRNYFELVQAEMQKKPRKNKISDEPETIYDPEDLRQAREANALMGIG